MTLSILAIDFAGLPNPQVTHLELRITGTANILLQDRPFLPEGNQQEIYSIRGEVYIVRARLF